MKDRSMLLLRPKAEALNEGCKRARFLLLFSDGAFALLCQLFFSGHVEDLRWEKQEKERLERNKEKSGADAEQTGKWRDVRDTEREGGCQREGGASLSALTAIPSLSADNPLSLKIIYFSPLSRAALTCVNFVF